MAPAQLADQSLLLTSCSHILCENCVREMGTDYARDVTFCAACNADCRAITVTRDNFVSQSPEIQDVLAPRASEAILDQAIQRVARIESFKRQQFRDQIIVQQKNSAKHAKEIQSLRRDNEQLQHQYDKLRQENKRLAQSQAPGSSSSRYECFELPLRRTIAENAVAQRSIRSMAEHAVEDTGAEGGFFAQTHGPQHSSSRPRTQSAERSSRPRTSRTAGRARTAGPTSSPSPATFARPSTRGGSVKRSQLLHQTPPRRPYTVRASTIATSQLSFPNNRVTTCLMGCQPGESAQSAVGQVLGGMSSYQRSAPDRSPGTADLRGQRIDRFGKYITMNLH